MAPSALSACPGKLDTGFPTGTCTKQKKKNLEHDPEKRKPVFRKDHAPPKIRTGGAEFPKAATAAAMKPARYCETNCRSRA
jgi:hypothetical protein